MQMRLEGYSCERSARRGVRRPARPSTRRSSGRSNAWWTRPIEQVRRLEALRLDEMSRLSRRERGRSCGDRSHAGHHATPRAAPGVGHARAAGLRATLATAGVTPTQVGIEIINNPDRTLRRLEAALEERGQPPRSTGLNEFARPLPSRRIGRCGSIPPIFALRPRWRGGGAPNRKRPSSPHGANGAPPKPCHDPRRSREAR